jgi:hypothetical protein
MDTIRRGDEVRTISLKLKVPEKHVKMIVNSYIQYIKDKLGNGESIGVLRICDFNVRGYDGERDTFSYACTEVGRRSGFSPELVKGVLFYYEDCMIRELKRYYTHSLTGLMTIQMSENYKKDVKVSITKSRCLCPGVDYRMSVRKSFRRKVEEYDRENA